jgi:hypothetical protein
MLSGSFVNHSGYADCVRAHRGRILWFCASLDARLELDYTDVDIDKRANKEFPYGQDLS